VTGQWKRLAEATRVKPGSKVDLAEDFDPGRRDERFNKDAGLAVLADATAALVELQDRFFAQADRALLIVLQAIDAAGKDGTIKHVMSGLNPEGVDVHSFRAPSVTERAHDYLWRHHRALPELGRIAVFNRSTHSIRRSTPRPRPSWGKQRRNYWATTGDAAHALCARRRRPIRPVNCRANRRSRGRR
jgi:polyphosphate kinase 2 (PPK2 family)